MIEEDYLREIRKCSNVDYSNLTCDEKKRFKSALASALDIRKFEIDMYWKRATYFWTFISVIYGGYFIMQNTLNNAVGPEFLKLLYNEQKVLQSNVSLEQINQLNITISQFAYVQNLYLMLFAISAVGLIFSLAWVCVNRGSKFWQNNWERHVDLLEDIVHGPIYKYVLFDKPSLLNVKGSHPFSVSKINQLVSVFVLFISIIIFFGEFWRLISISELETYGYCGFVFTSFFSLYMISSSRSELGSDFNLNFFHTTSKSQTIIFFKLIEDTKNVFIAFSKEYILYFQIFNPKVFVSLTKKFFNLETPKKINKLVVVKRKNF